MSVKYPRTPHLPFSCSVASDDKTIKDSDLAFLMSGVPLVVTEKMDGGNLTMTSTEFHGRSLSSTSNPWDTPAKALWATIRHDIPEGWRITGESMHARRSVSYEGLASPFLVFGVWDADNNLLSWDSMVEWTELLGLTLVPLLYRGNDWKAAISAWSSNLNDDISEGFVVRLDDLIPYDEFGTKVAKYVRANHVRTTAAWRNRDDFALNTYAPVSQ